MKKQERRKINKRCAKQHAVLERFTANPYFVGKIRSAVKTQADEFARYKKKKTCIMAENGLKLNNANSEFLAVMPAPSGHSLAISDLHVGEAIVCPSKTVRSLGCMFDSTNKEVQKGFNLLATRMQMEPQVTAVCQAANFHLRNIDRIRRYLSVGATVQPVQCLRHLKT